MLRYPPSAAYCSRDVLTEPPTTVTIVLQAGGAEGAPATAVEAPYKIWEADVEPTDGWRNRQGKSQLSICFMHSFGKCSGRVAGDPSSCHQIHIKPEVLESLRKQYKHKVRTYFCRTIKAHLQPSLREMLSRIAKKDLTLKYLEYRTQDVEPTEALYRYEQAYRQWLQQPLEGVPSVSAPSTTMESGSAQQVPFPDAAVEQCTAFAVEGHCPNGPQCHAVHCHVSSAQVRDRAVSTALQQLHRPPSFASFVQQQSPYPSAVVPAPPSIAPYHHHHHHPPPPTGATAVALHPLHAGPPPGGPNAPVYFVLLQPSEPAGPPLAPPSTPPSSAKADPFTLMNSRAVTPSADFSSAGALTPSHSSGAFDRNPSSAFFVASAPNNNTKNTDSAHTPQMSFQLLSPSSQPLQQQLLPPAPPLPSNANDLFVSFRNHFTTPPTTANYIAPSSS